LDAHDEIVALLEEFIEEPVSKFLFNRNEIDARRRNRLWGWRVKPCHEGFDSASA
jgi:hypothetical protein